jgi:iron complex outermembrane receptor protein
MPSTLRLLLLILITTASFAQDLTLPTLDVKPPKTAPTKQQQSTNINAQFTQTEIKQSGQHSLSQFFQQTSLASINAHSSNPGQKTITMHGFGDSASANSLLLIDGVAITAFSDKGPNLDAFLLHTIDHIDILPGSYGVRYGNQAVGGVVAIHTRIPDTPQAILEASMGNQEYATTNLFLSRRIHDTWGVSVDGQVANDGHSPPHSAEENTNLAIKVDHINEHGQSSANFIHYQHHAELPNGTDGYSGLPASEANNTETMIGNLFYLTHQQNLTPDWDLNSRALIQQNETHSSFFSSHEQQNGLLLNNSLRYQQHWLSGLQLEQDHYHSDNNKVHNYADENIAELYTQNTLPLSKRLKLRLGIRYASQWLDGDSTSTNIQENNTAFVNTQALLWQQTPALSFFIKRDTNYRFVKGNELLWTDSPEASENLAPQTGTAYESGFTWQQQKHRIALGIYELKLNNELSYTPLPLPFGEMTNLPPTRRDGIDLSDTQRLSPSLRLRTGLGYVNAKIDSGVYKGKQIPNVSPLHASATLSYKAARDYLISVTERYQSSFYASDDFDNTQAKAPGYFLTNLNLHKSWHLISANLHITNLLNKHYLRYSIYSPAAPDAGFPELLTNYSADGIRIDLSLSCQLV